jgi:hypothetical protein
MKRRNISEGGLYWKAIFKYVLEGFDELNTCGSCGG